MITISITAPAAFSCTESRAKPWNIFANQQIDLRTTIITAHSRLLPMNREGLTEAKSKRENSRERSSFLTETGEKRKRDFARKEGMNEEDKERKGKGRNFRDWPYITASKTRPGS